MNASIVIRTFNEERHLPDVLASIASQRCDGIRHETLIVDSGSTDGTLEVAAKHNCKILHINKGDFSFGRSLNMGCQAAVGEYLVFVSGHCIPVGAHWLGDLIKPLAEKAAALTYGRQVGGETSRFSECRIFEKYYPAKSKIPQEGFFCNNANAALPRKIWQDFPFDEELTGLEDMWLGKRLVERGLKIGYVAEACVLHLHDESWSTVRNRFEREAIALQRIMPQIHISASDFLRYFGSAMLHDCADALQQKKLFSRIPEILMYRLMQYWGAYRGNHLHRKLSSQMKERYFYPR
jgi:rhamnosyltransferase